MARYNRGSVSNTISAAKKSASAKQQPLFIHPTALGFNITDREDHAKSGWGYIKVHVDGKLERFTREPGEPWKKVFESAGMTSILGPKIEEIKLGLRTIGRVNKIGPKYIATALVSDPSGQKMIEKHIGDYDSYDSAREVILRIRNAEPLVIPETMTSKTEQEILAAAMSEEDCESSTQLILENKEDVNSFDNFASLAKRYYVKRREYKQAQKDGLHSSQQLSKLGATVDDLQRQVRAHPVNRADFWKQNPKLMIKLDKLVKESSDSKSKNSRCWDGYEPVPGKKPYSKGSCQKK